MTAPPPARIRVIEVALGLSIEEHLGGAELFTVNLAAALDPSMFEVAVGALWQFGSASEHKWRTYLQQRDIKTYFFAPHTGQLEIDLRRAIWTYLRMIQDFKPHIVNTHAEFVDLLNLYAHLVGRERFVPVRTLHLDREFDVMQHYHPLFIKMIRLLHPLFCPVDIGVSRNIVTMLNQRPLARLLGRRAHLLYNATRETDLLARQQGTDIRAELKIDETAPLIGFVGRLTDQKDPLLFLRVAQETHASLPNAYFLLVGTGPLEPELKQFVQTTGMSHRVLFLGSRSDAPDIIQQMSLLLSTSQWEGFPSVIIETMLLKTPVIARSIPGVDELVVHQHTGLLIPPQAPVVRWHHAIRYLLEQPAAANLMVTQARQHIDQFSMERTIEQYQRLYSCLPVWSRKRGERCCTN
jgi:glycosyltransferase involved in cell wall biosynthesis